jgi:hypothetical protein
MSGDPASILRSAAIPPLVSGVWYYTDYEYTAAGTDWARLSSPAEGSVLPGATATFNWSAPIYLRLWSLVGGIWRFNDYDFRANDGGSVRGRMISPIDQSVLIGSSTTFTWSSGSGATQYWLYVGTSVGAANLWNQNVGVGLSTSVSGLPTNGSVVCVRLWSLVSGVWVYNDYEYFAAP